ncbi:hypothetical protein [Rhizobium binxianense]|uniref:hypothetical protein n=1 Tax=Rhizobium binxianense TaxID=3024242 RepID=UPI00234E97CB|nr:hypothetical protein [Rhizobium sp. BC56]MDC7742485.1 hypothetical protein [Rhizobium sp. BC56]
MFATFANIRPGPLKQIAKAEPDIQALIAERVEAGEIFTAAKVKVIHDRPPGGAGGAAGNIAKFGDI